MFRIACEAFDIKATGILNSLTLKSCFLLSVEQNHLFSPPNAVHSSFNEMNKRTYSQFSHKTEGLYGVRRFQRVLGKPRGQFRFTKHFLVTRIH